MYVCMYVCIFVHDQNYWKVSIISYNIAVYNQYIPLSLVRKRQYGCGRERAKTLYSQAAKLLGLDMIRIQKGGIDIKIWSRRFSD